MAPRVTPEAADRIAGIEAGIGASIFAVDRAVPVPPPLLFRRSPADADNLALARQIVKARNGRGRFFVQAMFGEPCWDMLLDLYIARVSRTSVSITSASIASRVPPTTALRHIAILQDQGYVLRQPDPFDGRRTHLTLSDAGLDAMNLWLDGVRPVEGGLSI